MLNCLLVGLGGFSGAVLRYLMGMLPLGAMRFPIHTFFINFSGALLIGVLSELADSHGSLSPGALLFLKTGLCGGFTTFSTFSLESAGLLSQGRTMLAMVYMVGSVLVCVAAVYAGKALVRFFCT